MPRYYFNLCTDECETTDLVGRECADDVAALSEALKEAGEIVRRQLFFNRFEEGWVEVEDENHREVMRLPLRAAAGLTLISRRRHGSSQAALSLTSAPNRA